MKISIEIFKSLYLNLEQLELKIELDHIWVRADRVLETALTSS